MYFWLWFATVLPSCIQCAIIAHENQASAPAAFLPASPAGPSFSIVGSFQAAAPAPAPAGVDPQNTQTLLFAPPAASSATPAPMLGSAVIIRGMDELAISQSAQRSAMDNSFTAFTLQQQLVAEQSVEGSKETYKKVTPIIPEIKAQALKVRKYALLASQHRNHAKKVELEFQRLEKEAADVARKAAAGWISADAEKTAERTAPDKAVTIAAKGNRLAAAVARAAEPYHLALLRNQKFCEETHSKAKSAQSSSLQLIADAKQLALKAQELQASGMGISAVESMTLAKGMMTQAEDLRQWGTKLWSQANKACATAGGYTVEEQQAAFNAAATTPVNAPMKLPKRLRRLAV